MSDHETVEPKNGWTLPVGDEMVRLQTGDFIRLRVRDVNNQGPGMLKYEITPAHVDENGYVIEDRLFAQLARQVICDPSQVALFSSRFADERANCIADAAGAIQAENLKKTIVAAPNGPGILAIPIRTDDPPA